MSLLPEYEFIFEIKNLEECCNNLRKRLKGNKNFYFTFKRATLGQKFIIKQKNNNSSSKRKNKIEITVGDDFNRNRKKFVTLKRLIDREKDLYGEKIIDKENNNIIEYKIENKLFFELLSLGIKDLTFNLISEEKIALFYEIIKSESTKKLTSLFYELRKLREDIVKNSEKIIEIEKKIKESIIFKNYTLDERDSSLQNILDEFYEVYKTLSLKELQKIVSNAKDEEARLFFGAIVNYYIKVNFKKALENEKY